MVTSICQHKEVQVYHTKHPNHHHHVLNDVYCNCTNNEINGSDRKTEKMGTFIILHQIIFYKTKKKIKDCTDLYQFLLSARVQVMRHSISLSSQAILSLCNYRG